MRGRDKLMELVDGVPLLKRQIYVVLDAGLSAVVTYDPGVTDRLTLLRSIKDDRLTLVPVKDAKMGISASLRAGVTSLATEAVAVMVLLPDLPDVTTSDILNIAAAFDAHPNDVIRATDENGRPGHPVIVPRHLFSKILGLTGDQGAKHVLKNEDIRLFPLAGTRAVTDLDTPEDWANWRALTGC